ncbi:MAG: class I SAM-dependent methyltransferase [Candidatus Dojkabacteria bacterium]|nr:class I SAM-dependent methyltransferase [Candidatus Dojkabacteria bacterium]
MASPIEEDFVYSEIEKLPLNSNILEFGCGDNMFTNKIQNLGHNVTAVDLYYRTSNINFKFIKGDFENINIPTNNYNCIYALSSFEHIGMERNNILSDTEITYKIQRILNKMKLLLKNNSILLITLPFGNFSKYYVTQEGKWSCFRKPNSIWGAKVYDNYDIKEIFKDFILLKEEYYLRIGKDFFDKNHWIQLPPEKCYIKKEITDSIACLKFKN